MRPARTAVLQELIGATGLISDGDWIESHDQDPAGSIRLIQLADIGDGQFLNKSRRYINEDTADRLRCTLVEPGDVLIARMPDPLGRACVFPDIQQKAVTAVDICIVRPDPAIADPHWLSLFINSPVTRAHILTLAQGATRARVPTGQLRKLIVSLPTLSQQRAIAALLKAQVAAVEDGHQAASAQATEVIALRAALYREAFANIVPVTVPPEFITAPPGWRWARLSDLARLESGHTPSRSRPDWWGGEISWLSLTEIRALDGQWVESTQLRTNPAGISNSAARVLPRGTVCFSRTASVGFVAIMGEPMATSQDFANWVCGDDLDPEFLMHALMRSRKELRAIATGATHKTIYMPALHSFQLCLPPRAEQERIVARLKQQLAAVEILHDGVQQRLVEIERLPARLLAQSFEPPAKASEGELDLPDGAARSAA